MRVNLLFLVLQDKDTYGGSFLYHLNEDSPLVAVGFVVSTSVPHMGLPFVPTLSGCIT